MRLATAVLSALLLGARAVLSQVPDTPALPVLAPANFSSLDALPDPNLLNDEKSLTWPQRVLSPYVSLGSTNDDITSYHSLTSTKYFTLAFILSDSLGNPCWSGQPTLGLTYYADKIAAIRAAGGDVIISFGGAYGLEIAQSGASLQKVTDAYMSVVKAYRVRWIDFDIEGGRESDSASVDLRNRAIAAVQKQASWKVRVSYTLAAETTGLGEGALGVLRSAMKYGVDVGVVNLMTMDFGTWAAPNGATGMGTYSIAAAVATKAQLESIKSKAQIGITPMIGVNDMSDEVFRVLDATNVAKWAKGCGYVAWIGFWSINRDNGHMDALYDSSMVKQVDGAYGNAFRVFEG
ncbi:hypothetical protein HK101_004817 [Irineochytrium annulatum]|nr:hypothetical protein HK101_004817 [Irineochytrium annulatum]